MALGNRDERGLPIPHTTQNPGALNRKPRAVEDHGVTAWQLDALDGVVTGCALAIAETGTFVLAGGSTEGRRALTLVPDRHVCIVMAPQVMETVPRCSTRSGASQAVRSRSSPVRPRHPISS
jgi:L-lactate dehydrogenase complex protein LldG